MTALKEIFIWTLLTLVSIGSYAQTLTVRQVVDKILVELGTEINTGSVDTLKSGSWNQPVTGIATTFMATLDVLKKAEAEGINLILTHEPTYYNHFDFKDHYGEEDPVVQAKLDFINKNKLVILRFHDLPHQIKDDMIYQGLINILGWEKYHQGDMVFESPYENVQELSEFLSNHFGTSTVRVVGDPEFRLNKIGVLPGAYDSRAQVEKFKNGDIDALIVGESREWETIEYARDAQELGWEKALIVMGHADSEEPGMGYTAEWLKELFPDLKVKFIPAGNPLWSPK
jgi:putative NIF3 family GTP cyclohydrolase 1 type 2